MNYGSVCSGVESVTLAWEPLGWKPRFFAEVEPFPAAVLCHRFGATRPLRPLDPAEADTVKDCKLREGWRKQIAELPPYGTIPNLGDFTKIRNDDYDGAIDLLVGGTPCFPAGNLVLTEHGYKPIEDIRVGDFVMTHLGRLRRVLATGNKIADNVGKCRVVGRPEFSVTGNHPFWVCPDARSEPEFRAVEDSVGLYAGQLDGFPISPTASKDIYRKDRWTFGRILSFKPTGVSEIVYNLEVEDDNSYVANGICVHNCQSYSVAGLRKGLADPRGNLALEFIRLAYHAGARWVVWENVPGILSSGRGQDFAGFLSLLCGWEVPVPAKGWRKAGIVTPAPGCYGLAWRILDAQYTRTPEYPRAVPQRRRRLFVIGYLGSWEYPAKVLLDGEVRPGDSPPRRAKRTGVAHSLTASTGGVSAKEQQTTFIGASGEPLNALCMAHGQANAEIAEENAPTLSCNHEAPLVCTEPRAVYCCDARGNGDGETANTITGDHAGHANDYMPVVAFTANDNGRDCMNECSPTLRKGGETPADGGAIVPAVVESEPLAFIKNDAGGDQDGYWRGVFPTLRTEITPAVAYDTIQLDPLETPVALGGEKWRKRNEKTVPVSASVRTA